MTTQDTVLRIVGRVLSHGGPISEPLPTDTLADLGVDPIDYLGIWQCLEDEFIGLEISEAQVAGWSSVADIIKTVEDWHHGTA